MADMSIRSWKVFSFVRISMDHSGYMAGPQDRWGLLSPGRDDVVVACIR